MDHHWKGQRAFLPRPHSETLARIRETECRIGTLYKEFNTKQAPDGHQLCCFTVLYILYCAFELGLKSLSGPDENCLEV